MFYMHLTLTGLLDLGVLFQTQVFSTFNGNVHFGWTKHVNKQLVD